MRKRAAAGNIRSYVAPLYVRHTMRSSWLSFSWATDWITHRRLRAADWQQGLTATATSLSLR